MKSEEYSRREQEVGGWRVSVEVYRAGDVYHCSISSIDPGARFARADGATKDEAESLALAKAERYLLQTRRFPIVAG